MIKLIPTVPHSDTVHDQRLRRQLDRLLRDAGAGGRQPGDERPGPFNHHLLVDQFGYRPGDPKVAVVREAQVGTTS